MSADPEPGRFFGDHRQGEIPKRSYRNPPVVEALCEIYFAESSWDDTVPGAFYERVRSRFPRKQRREIQEARITMGPETSTAGVQRLPPWMQFLTEDGSLMIQVAENLVVVNQLLPYRHFENWEPVIYEMLNVYNEVALPERIVRIGLRYINRIEIPGPIIPMEEYFKIYPNLPPSLGNRHGAFLVRVEVPQAELEHSVLITFGPADTPQLAGEPQAFMLDLYDRVSRSLEPNEAELKKEVRTAHSNVVMAFEGSITDQLRDLLGVEERT